MKYLLTITTLLFPGVLLAQEAKYNLLEPSFLGPEQGPIAPSFVDYLNTVYTTVFVLIVLFAILFIIIGGIQYSVSQVPGAKSDGKKMISSAIWGLIIALASWLILYTINPNLVTFNFIRTDVEIIDTTGTGPSGGTGGTGTGQLLGRYGPLPTNEFIVREILLSNDIKINDHPACSEDNPGACRTYVGNLHTTWITFAINRKNRCDQYNQQFGHDCDFVITGAGEPGGHTSGSRHYAGRAIDIRTTPSFVSYMNNDYLATQAVLCGKTAQQLSSGNLETCGTFKYKYEGDHWHIEN